MATEGQHIGRVVQIIGALEGQYPEQDGARRAAFERDKASLKDIGVPLQTTWDDTAHGTARYSIRGEDWFLDLDLDAPRSQHGALDAHGEPPRGRVRDEKRALGLPCACRRAEGDGRRLGVQLEHLAEDKAPSLGLGQARGALINDITAGGPASSSGLRAGDAITAVDNDAIRDSRELAMQDWLGSAGFDREEDHWPRKWAEAYVDWAAGEKRAWVRQNGVKLFPVVGWAERGGYLATGHGNSVPRFHITWGTGPGLVEPFLRRVMRACKRGPVDVRCRHRVDGVTVRDETLPCGVLEVTGSAADRIRGGSQDDAPNRIADLNPNDIESIEIVKGPAAATLYGADASAGFEVYLHGGRTPTGIDALSFGPWIEGPHAPGEQLNIPSAGRFMRLLGGLLDDLSR